ncbi:MFS transporter [Streptomyces sp. NPDC087787]|uniref:MFS transporter n=1 Tax=Streptomyces sp. NPDC087787 TaxID=3365803 RepID=UPI00380AF0B1
MSTGGASAGLSPNSGGSTAESKRWWSLTTVLLSTFMAQLDNTVVNVALPSIGRDLDLEISGIEWIISSYMLVFASLLLLGGRLADLIGTRRILMIGITVFTVASLFAGLADSFGMLLAGRALQGVGAALSTPATLMIILATFKDERERGKAIGLWGAVIALSFAFGPIVGGVITRFIDWGWIFFINVPIGVVAVAIGMWSIDRNSGVTQSRRLDTPGLVSSGIVLFGLTYALIEGPKEGWTAAPILGAFAAVVVALIVFCLVELRFTDPMFDLTLFRNGTFSWGTAALVLWGCGMMGVFAYTSLYLQNVLDFSPVLAGAVFIPLAVVMAVVATVSGKLAEKFGLMRTVLTGFIIAAVGLALLAIPGDSARAWELQPALILVGIGAGAVTPLQTAVASALPVTKVGVASGVLNAFREMSALCGVTVLGAVVSSVTASRISSGDGPKVAYLDGYHTGVLIASALIFAGTLTAFLALRQIRPADTAEAESSAQKSMAPAES